MKKEEEVFINITVQHKAGEVALQQELSVSPEDYTLQVKEALVQSGNRHEIIELIAAHNGPCSPDVRLSFKGIELNNMFHLNKYGIGEGDVVLLSFGPDKRAADPLEEKETSLADETTCRICGKKVKDPAELKYHSGSLGPQEWVYGLTVKWKWSCCGMIVSTPDRCFHPEGCMTGICPDCRPDCPCHQARAIRREEEENF